MTIAGSVTLVRAFPWEGEALGVIVGPGKAAQVTATTRYGSTTFLIPETTRRNGPVTFAMGVTRIERRPGRRRVWVVS